MTLTFNGIFSDVEIDEIREKIELNSKLNSKPLLVTSAQNSEEELEILNLSNGKHTYIFPLESNGLNGFKQNIERIELFPSDLRNLFTRFFKETYNYIPDFTVDIDAGIWLPVELKFFEDNDDFEEELKSKDTKFMKFWEMFQEDLARMKNKHYGGSFEYGDKVLQLIFEHGIYEYSLTNAKSGDDIIFTEEENDGSVIVSVDRERKIIYLPTYKVSETYTSQKRQDVLGIILHGLKPEELKRHIWRGFNLKAPLVNGMCALHIAVKEKKYDKVKALIEEAVDVNMKDNNGYTAMAYAVLNDDIIMIDYLKSYQANLMDVGENDSAFSLAKNKKTEKYLMRYL